MLYPSGVMGTARVGSVSMPTASAQSLGQEKLANVWKERTLELPRDGESANHPNVKRQISFRKQPDQAKPERELFNHRWKEMTIMAI